MKSFLLTNAFQLTCGKSTDYGAPVSNVRVKLLRDGSVRDLDPRAARLLISLNAAVYLDDQPTPEPEPQPDIQYRKLIAIITCHGQKFLDKAEAQRQTWVPIATELGFDVKFFLGVAERPARDDEVYLAVDDGYAGLPAKVQCAAAWAHRHGYDYVFKTDDDVYIIPSRLLKCHVAPHDFVGRFRIPSGGYPAEYASGFGYWLSAKAMAVLADAQLNGDWAEDRFVANVLANAGIYGMSDWINYVAPNPPVAPDVIGRCGVNVAAVFCQFNAQEMKQMHTIFVRRPHPTNAQYALTPAPRYEVPNERLAAKPKDWIPSTRPVCP